MRDATKPLGVADLLHSGDHRQFMAEEDTPWYWCRFHEQSHRADRVCKGGGAYLPVGKLDGDDCIDVGPFMSEREANRLRGKSEDGRVIWDKALGMEVET